VSVGRLETLTDGIFAIVMTLLVLELRIPEIHDPAGGALAQALRDLAPKLLSFAISFVILGVYWVAHHTQFQYIRRADHTLIWLNIFLLLCVSVVPFSTAMLGQYVGDQVAAAFYGTNLIAIGVLHYAMWGYATSGLRLVDESMDPRVVGFGSLLSLLPVAAYLLAILVAFVAPLLSIMVYALVPLPYILGLFYRFFPR